MDYRSRGANNMSSRSGARAGTDRHGGRGGTNQFSSSGMVMTAIIFFY